MDLDKERIRKAGIECICKESLSFLDFVLMIGSPEPLVERAQELKRRILNYKKAVDIGG